MSTNLTDINEAVLMDSGGGGSWAAGHRFKDRHPEINLHLLFTDVKGDDDNPFTGEDIDTYRFLREGATDIGAPLTILRDGRDIWDTFLQHSWLGNSILSHCSWELKTLPARNWLDENRDPKNTVVIVGMDWTEGRRHAGVHRGYAHNLKGCANTDQCSYLFSEDGRHLGPGCKNLLTEPWRVVMPMTERPLLAKPQVLDLMKQHGIKPPRMYALGFPHANCIGCVKAGVGHWERVSEVFPEHYAYAEKREQEFRDSKPSRANVSILSYSVGSTADAEKFPLPLSALRQRIEAKDTGQLDLEYDWGGCGCVADDKPAEIGETP